MISIFDTAWVIEVKLEEGSPRVCDYCNNLLVNEDGVVEETCFSTEYGLVCKDCRGDIPPLLAHKIGINVKHFPWYMED